MRTKNRYGLGLTRRSARYRSETGRAAGVEALPPGEHDLDDLATDDRFLGLLDRSDDNPREEGWSRGW